MLRLTLGWWRQLWCGGLRPGSSSSLLFATLCIGLATIVRILLGELSTSSAVFAPCYSATLVAALVGGTQAGTLAALLGAIAAFLLFVPPDWASHAFDQNQLVNVLLFAGSSGVIIWAAQSYRALLWQLRDEQERRQLLNHELVHRINNILTIVQAVIGQTLRADPEARDRLRNRIAALAATNDLLVRAQWRGASVERILAGEFAPYDPGRFLLYGEDFECPAQIATVLALIFHELTTNAAKYGALSAPRGRVVLSWTKRGNRVEFDWAEREGPPPAEERHDGFGTVLLRQGLRQFDGAVQMAFTPHGLHCRLSLALPSPQQEETVDLASRESACGDSTLPLDVTAGNAELALHPPRLVGQK